MTMNETEKEALDIAARVGGSVLPELLGWIADLIKGGHSESEAKEIVRENIQSRRAQYDRERKEDMELLKKKWPEEG